MRIPKTSGATPSSSLPLSPKSKSKLNTVFQNTVGAAPTTTKTKFITERNPPKQRQSDKAAAIGAGILGQNAMLKVKDNVGKAAMRAIQRSSSKDEGESLVNRTSKPKGSRVTVRPQGTKNL